MKSTKKWTNICISVDGKFYARFTQPSIAKAVKERLEAKGCNNVCMYEAA